MDIKGKTLGLLGTGRIGSHMARLGWAFGMKVIAYDVRSDVALKEKYGVQFMSLEEVLEQADVWFTLLLSILHWTGYCGLKRFNLMILTG